MRPESYPIISRVKERDTTFLLIEFLASSPEFREWFIDQLSSHTGRPDFLGVTRSVETHGRETDIRVEFDVCGIRYLALIENKIAADFGEGQIPDYHERASRYKREGRCDNVVVVLLAPANRADSATKEQFDHVITYEQVCDRLKQMSHDSTPVAEEVFRIALEQQGGADKSALMARLADQIQPVLGNLPGHLEIEATDNRIRIESTDADFPAFIRYEIRAKFGTLGTIAPGIRVLTDDNDDLRTIHQVLASRFEEISLDNYHTQLANDHQKKQGMVEWVTEVPGEPDAVSDSQIQRVVNAMQTLIEHYHEPLQTAFSD